MLNPGVWPIIRLSLSHMIIPIVAQLFVKLQSVMVMLAGWSPIW